MFLIQYQVKHPCSTWQEWSEWSHCSTTCGKGSKIRARACSGSEGSCSGKWTETKDCLLDKCIVEKEWQGWSEWSKCSSSCSKTRARSCSGGHGSCSGEWTETKDCLLDKCPVIIGKWQEWGPWAQCSTTCGKGAKIRARPCSKNDGSCPGEPQRPKIALWLSV